MSLDSRHALLKLQYCEIYKHGPNPEETLALSCFVVTLHLGLGRRASISKPLSLQRV